MVDQAGFKVALVGALMACLVAPTAASGVPDWLKRKLTAMEENASRASGILLIHSGAEFAAEALASADAETKPLLEKLSKGEDHKFNWTMKDGQFKAVETTIQVTPSGDQLHRIKTTLWKDGKNFTFEDFPERPTVALVGYIGKETSGFLHPLQLRQQYFQMPLVKALGMINASDLGEQTDAQGNRVRLLRGYDNRSKDHRGAPVSEEVLITLNPDHGYTVKSISQSWIDGDTHKQILFEVNREAKIDGVWMPTEGTEKSINKKKGKLTSSWFIQMTATDCRVGHAVANADFKLPVGAKFKDDKNNFWRVNELGELVIARDEESYEKPKITYSTGASHVDPFTEGQCRYEGAPLDSRSICVGRRGDRYRLGPRQLAPGDAL